MQSNKKRGIGSFEWTRMMREKYGDPPPFPMDIGAQASIDVLQRRYAKEWYRRKEIEDAVRNIEDFLDGMERKVVEVAAGKGFLGAKVNKLTFKRLTIPSEEDDSPVPQ